MADDRKADLETKKSLGFLDSSQCKHWLFDSLDEIRQRQLHSFHTELPRISAMAADDKDISALIPSDEEYLHSLSYFCKEIIEICRRFRFPPYVACTAVTYFKRFFLNSKCNLISMDAMVIKDTCIYLASKSEQCLFTGVHQLTAVTQTHPDQVIDHELVVMDAIHFQLKIWSPLRAFRSFINDFKSVYKQKKKANLSEKYEAQICKQGQDLIQDSYISDVSLLYTPSQIALACLLMAVSCIDIAKDADKAELRQMSIAYFNERFGCKDGKDAEKKQRFVLLQETVKQIQNLIIKAMDDANPKANNNKTKMQKIANTKIYKLGEKYHEYKKKKKSKKVKGGRKVKEERVEKKEVKQAMTTTSVPQVKVEGHGNVDGHKHGLGHREQTQSGAEQKPTKKKFTLKLQRKSANTQHAHPPHPPANKKQKI